MGTLTLIAVFNLLLLFSTSVCAHAQNESSYLILQDIANYTWKNQGRDFITGKVRQLPGFTVRGGPGLLGGAGHFSLDHNDITYDADYVNSSVGLGVEVQVTQHAGADSDKWLLHEVEDGYRDGEMERLGLVTKGARLRDVSGNKIISLRGSGYSWISSNVAVEISYTDLEGTKPEPLEVVQAYLQKFPSTIPSTLVLDKAHDEQWIKDEIDRRLWLCDKWDMQFQLGKVQQKDMLQEQVKSMEVFLNYREKYYSMKAADEKNLLAGYLSTNNRTAIKNRLDEYKQWWSANKTRAISIQ